MLNRLLHSRSQNFKSKIVDLLTKEGENWIGCGMTYTLFEFVKEQLSELLDELEEESKNAAALKAITEETKAVHLAPVIKTTETVIAKKEQMTKNQKRRLWDRTNNKGERERGWNWVDIIRHLSSTGHKEESQEAVGQLAPPPNN